MIISNIFKLLTNPEPRYSLTAVESMDVRCGFSKILRLIGPLSSDAKTQGKTWSKQNERFSHDLNHDFYTYNNEYSTEYHNFLFSLYFRNFKHTLYIWSLKLSDLNP